LYSNALMFGQYTLHNKLGQGGYSTVYKCTDAIGVRYACKQLPKQANKRSRVEQEIKIMQSLDSPKLVRYVDAGEDDDNFYIISELCRGGVVKEYVANYGHFAENTVASIIRGVLRGLVHMHEKGIIHRDIKSGNVLLADKSEDADVKIADFGTSIYEGAKTTGIVGTPWFLSPESLCNACCTKSDVWSVGVMTYQLLSGVLPFNDREYPMNPRLRKLWLAILADDPKFTGTTWVDIDPDAIDFIKQCLQKEQINRPDAITALRHPWLTRTDCNDRFKGQPLTCHAFGAIGAIGAIDENAQTIHL